MTTTAVDMDTNVPINRLPGHTDNVKITTVKDGSIHRDILKDIMFPLGKKGKKHMQPSTQLGLLTLTLLAQDLLLLVHMTTEFTIWASLHFGEGTINLQFPSISFMGHHLLVIQLRLVIEMNL